MQVSLSQGACLVGDRIPLSDLRELQLRLAELYRLRDEYAARPGGQAMARYIDMLTARLEAEITAGDHPMTADADPQMPVRP